MNTNDFIKKIGTMAQKNTLKNSLPASMTIAQAILESGWGGSRLTIDANNLFGIKGRYKGNGYVCDTFEYVDGKRIDIKAEFRKYESWQESLYDHSEFLRGVKLPNGALRYAAVIGETDYRKACKAIQAAGYATSPIYADTLIRLIEQYNLHEFDSAKKPPPPVPYYIWVGRFVEKNQADEASKKITALGWYNEVRKL